MVPGYLREWGFHTSGKGLRMPENVWHLLEYSLHGDSSGSDRVACGADTDGCVLGFLALHHVTCRICLHVARSWIDVRLQELPGAPVPSR